MLHPYSWITCATASATECPLFRCRSPLDGCATDGNDCADDDWPQIAIFMITIIDFGHFPVMSVNRDYN